MSNKKFGIELRQLLSALNQNEKLTPAEVLEKVKTIRHGHAKPNESIVTEALKNPRFIRMFLKAYRRSQSGKVVFYIKGGAPTVMTYERMTLLKSSIKNASEGLRRYHEEHRATQK